jgi:cytochrome b subunit of formate dehydrogenase
MHSLFDTEPADVGTGNYVFGRRFMFRSVMKLILASLVTGVVMIIHYGVMVEHDHLSTTPVGRELK